MMPRFWLQCNFYGVCWFFPCLHDERWNPISLPCECVSNTQTEKEALVSLCPSGRLSSVIRPRYCTEFGRFIWSGLVRLKDHCTYVSTSTFAHTLSNFWQILMKYGTSVIWVLSRIFCGSHISGYEESYSIFWDICCKAGHGSRTV
jgi:hypothetical protein